MMHTATVGLLFYYNHDKFFLSILKIELLQNMDYETVSPVASSTQRRSRVARVISAAAFALFACAALITLLGAATEHGPSELYTITPNQALDKLALDFLKHGATMSVQDMESKLSAWHNSPATLLDMATHVKGLEPTQMLALGPNSILAGVRLFLDGSCSLIYLYFPPNLLKCLGSCIFYCFRRHQTKVVLIVCT
jgi:hypothetical protein